MLLKSRYVTTYAVRVQGPCEVRLSLYTEYLPILSKYSGFSLQMHIFLANVGRCNQGVVMPPGPRSMRLTLYRTLNLPIDDLT